MSAKMGGSRLYNQSGFFNLHLFAMPNNIQTLFPFEKSITIILINITNGTI